MDRDFREAGAAPAGLASRVVDGFALRTASATRCRRRALRLRHALRGIHGDFDRLYTEPASSSIGRRR
jgi:hypothetical protein